MEITWPNLLIIFWTIIETLQLSASILLASGIDDFRYLLFLGHNDMYYPIVWIGISFIIIWFFLVSLPVVVEEFFNFKSRGSFHGSPLWKVMNLLISTCMFTTILFILIKPIQCVYNRDQPSIAVVYADPSTRCW